MAQGGYHRSDGRWTPVDTTSGASALVVSATSNGTAVEMGTYGTARVDIVTTTVVSSPSLTFSIQTSKDNGATDPYRTVVTSAAVTTATTIRMSAGGLDRFARLQAVNGGTGSLTVNATFELAV